MGDRWLGAMFALAVAGTGSAQEPSETQFYWGTIRLVEDGVEHIPAAGWIDFCVENTGGKQRAEVTDGRWELPLAWPDIMEVVGVELDGRPAALRPAEKPWHEHGEYHLTADVLNRSVLHVVDAETGRALSDVRVATPNFYDELWADGASPLDVTLPQDACERFEPERTLRVSAPNYEPWDVTVDFERGGGYQVALEPRAALVLYSWPSVARPDLIVELGEGAAPRELAWDRPLVFEDLGAGVFDVQLRSGPWKLQKRLRIRAGEQVVHTLESSEQPPATTIGRQARGRTQLAGSLEISPHWRLREATVDIARFDEAKGGFKKTDSVALRPGEGRTWHWDAGTRRTGVYRVTVREIPWTFLCDVRGDEPVIRTLPEPKVLALRCVAARTREPLEVSEVRWKPLPSSKLPGPATDAVVRGRDRQGRIRLRAPEGWILVSARNDEYEVRERLVRITPETRELVIPLEQQERAPEGEGDYWGTITLVENGEERVPREGWIHFCIENGMEERVPVVDGQWSLQRPWPDVLHIADIALDGRPARLLGDVAWGRGRHELHAQIRPAVWLEATDMETGMALSNVIVSDVIPDGWVAARASGSTPLDITHSGDPCGAAGPWGKGPSGLVSVRAPGYDVEEVEVDFGRGGRFHVALERCGALVVCAAPDAELEVYELEVAGTRSSIVRRRLFRNRPTVFVDMLPDYYVLSISANGRLIAQERATVVAKRDTRVQLSKETLATSLGNPLDSKRPAQSRKLSGTLTVPAAYERDRLSLRVERLGTANEPTLVAELDAQRDSTGAWRWDAGPQHEGVYRVSTVDPPWAFLARVEKTAAFYERALPDPVEVVVRFVSGDSHEEVAPKSLEWCPLPLVPDVGGLPWRAVRSGADGTYRFTAPAGHVHVRAKADGFHVLHRRLHAGAGNPPAVLAFH